MGKVPEPFGTQSQAIFLPRRALGSEQPGTPWPSGPHTLLLLVQLVCEACFLPQKESLVPLTTDMSLAE